MKHSSLIKLFTLFLTNIIINQDINKHFSTISSSSFITLKSSLRRSDYNKNSTSDGSGHDGVTPCGHETFNCVGGYYITDQDKNKSNQGGSGHDGVTPCGHETPNCVGGYYITDQDKNKSNQGGSGHDGITPCGHETPNCVGGYYITD
ncbi:uncharacterized protein ELE39_000387 [Cryptosporidium sp. chipmunk genotype I]|uniref:uncharacterized protein n=1 Tax=Cryptosporidium sp. chipmunk genotype I TaxID=1280935 RepID=UPI00351A8FCD|nr:hypothetical protein ELE39_000387 [Cryptosporidium sp. chipmunk genotype I]